MQAKARWFTPLHDCSILIVVYRNGTFWSLMVQSAQLYVVAVHQKTVGSKCEANYHWAQS